MQTDKKNCFFAVRNVVTFDFVKVSFSGYLLVYGTAEAGEMITILKLISAVPGSGEDNASLGYPWGGYSIYPGMGRCGPAPDLTKTFD